MTREQEKEIFRTLEMLCSAQKWGGTAKRMNQLSYEGDEQPPKDGVGSENNPDNPLSLLSQVLHLKAALKAIRAVIGEEKIANRPVGPSYSSTTLLELIDHALDGGEVVTYGDEDAVSAAGLHDAAQSAKVRQYSQENRKNVFSLGRKSVIDDLERLLACAKEGEVIALIGYAVEPNGGVHTINTDHGAVDNGLMSYCSVLLARQVGDDSDDFDEDDENVSV